MPIILCDVDLTVVDPIPLWWEWLQIQSGLQLDFEAELKSRKIMPYDVSACFRERLSEPLCFNPEDFWRNEGIYDLMKPIPEAQQTLDMLHDAGYTIRFVSHCKGNHHKSKWNFLKRNFPYLNGFAATKEKFMLKGNIFIDDRVDHLNKMPPSMLKIQIKTPYQQSEILNYNNAYLATDWQHALQIIQNEG